MATPLLLGLFLASGTAALIYEVVWFQLLELVIGSSAISLAILLTTYMGGLFLGSLLLPSLLSLRQHPLRLYAFLEAGIGGLGLLIPILLPLVMKIYTATIGYGLPLLLIRGFVSAGTLLAPTILMGGTLPVVSRLVEATRPGLSFVGLLYGVNTAGAVLGTFGAGFYLLRVHDVTIATITAATINFIIASSAFSLSFLQPWKPSFYHKTAYQNVPEEKKRKEPEESFAGALAENQGVVNLNKRIAQNSRRRFNFKNTLISNQNTLINDSDASHPGLIYLVVAVSGLTALGAEVVWTRLLALSLGGTVYTFSLLLGIFLSGLAAGSAVSSKLIRRQRLSPRLALGLSQLSLAPAIIWAALVITRIVPNWSVSETAGPAKTFIFDCFRCSLAILPASFLWGASFPLALASATRRQAETGRTVGKIYAANTAGSIAGSLLISLVILPTWGSSFSQRLFILLVILNSFLALCPFLQNIFLGVSLRFERREKLQKTPNLTSNKGNNIVFQRRQLQPLKLKLIGSVILITAYSLAGFLAVRAVASPPWQLIAYGWKMAEKKDRGRPLVVAEGINSSVAVTEWEGTIVFHTSGRAEASNAAPDLRMERMLAHLPALVHQSPRRVLIVGCGAGITAGTFLLYPEVEKVVICEIEPAVWKKVVPYFKKENYNLASDPRVELVLEDARHFLLTSQEKFDIISSDPVHPWLRGSALLYTQEYFMTIQEHLSPSGLFTQWVPLYESDEATVKSLLATFFQVFPAGTIWSNDVLGWDYDFVLMGQKEDLPVDLDELEAKLERKSFQQVRESLKEIGFRSALELMATYVGRGFDLVSWFSGAPLNLDRNLRLQYLAGWGLHSGERVSLLELLWTNFRFPEDLFRGSPANLDAFKRLFPRH